MRERERGTEENKAQSVVLTGTIRKEIKTPHCWPFSPAAPVIGHKVARKTSAECEIGSFRSRIERVRAKVDSMLLRRSPTMETVCMQIVLVLLLLIVHRLDGSLSPALQGKLLLLFSHR